MSRLQNTKYFYSLVFLEITILTFLNYNANLMSGLIPLYLDFAQFFSSNFDLNLVFNSNNYTFPMWGYGFILLALKEKFIIIFFQQLLTFFTIILLDNLLIKESLLKQKIIFRFLILLIPHWYLFQTSVWPYSINSNLLVISSIYLVKYMISYNLKYLCISAVIFGISLNLRSDYYYFQIFIVLILFFNILKGKRSIIHILIYIFILNILLLPWGIYTYKKTNHYLQTSTNAGHVFYISLGQLPNNLWKITAKDEDSSMKSILEKRLNSKNVNSLSYESNIYLMNEWKKNVFKNPLEYIKKCGFNIFQLFTTPFYSGSIEKMFANETELNKIKRNIKYLYVNYNIIKLIKYILFDKGSIYVSNFFLNLLGVIFFLVFSFTLILLLIKKSLLTLLKNPFYKISIFIILYQITMNVMVFHMPIYNSNIILFYVFALSAMLERLFTIYRTTKLACLQ